MQRKSLKPSVIILYIILFFAVWSVVELLLTPYLIKTIGNESVPEILKESAVKLLLWTVPAFLLIRRYEADVYLSLKEMFTSKVLRLKYLPIFAGVALFVLAGNFVTHGRIAFSETFRVSDLVGSVLFVGITEEAVFRGWLLNATLRGGKKLLPVLINAGLFLAIHFPVWIRNGIFIECFTSFSFVLIFALGALFGWVFIKSRNLLVPIALHMFYNLMVDLFL